MTQTFKDRLREWEGPFDWINGRDLAADADQQLASKDAEIAALREDAERYRWMRQSLYWDGYAWWIPDLPVSSPDVHSLSQSDDVPYPTDAEIDASVDAEIEHDRAASKKG